MSISKLPSGRFRAQVNKAGRNVPLSAVLSPEAMAEFGAVNGTFATRTAAKRARAEAHRVLRAEKAAGVTVRDFWERWTTDELFARPKEQTDKHNRERTKGFVDSYGDLLLAHVGDLVVAEWLAGGKRNGTVPALRAMFNDARSAKAGRLIVANPFAGLGISRGSGNKHKQPPSVDEMERLIKLAHELTIPAFADYLEMACVTGIRPSELDAMRPEWVRWDDGEIDVREQWAAKVGKFDSPKYGPYTIALVQRARDVLHRAAEHSGREFCFETLRGTHFSPSARTHHWNKVRSAAGLGDTTLYLATRHYFGWYAVNVLEMDTAVVAEQLGHKDGGKLVEQLYGHPDKARRRRLLREAHDEAYKAAKRANRPGLRAIDGGAS